MSLRADVLKERSKIAGTTFDDLTQADFVLFMRDAVDSFKSKQHNTWVPEILVFSGTAQHHSKCLPGRVQNGISKRSENSLGSKTKLS
jgi:hypothetical protein